MTTRHTSWIPLAFTVALATLALLSVASPAHAGGIVTVCDEANFTAALAGGGTVSFNCNGTNDNAIIPFTGSKSITATTVVDGGGHITLRGSSFGASMLYVDSGAALALQNLAMVRNRTGGASGGAIYNNGTLALLRVDIADMDAGTAYGGAIYSSGTLTLTQSSLSNNRAGIGGAMRIGSGTASLVNSTLVANGASANVALAGDGVYLDPGTKMDLLNVTLSGNTYDANDQNIVVDGATLTLRNTLLSNSGQTNITRTTGTVTSLGYNLEDGVSGFLTATTDISNTDPLLTPFLFGYPGAPAYQAPNALSPAINAGDPANAPAVDQLGTPRPQIGRADIGAIEVIPTCFARVQSSGQVFTGTLAAEVQRAVDAAQDDDIVKVAGYCPHWQLRSGLRQAVFITRNLTLRGGYTPTNWALSNPLSNTTTIDPYFDPSSDPARGIFITATQRVTVENLTLVDGGRGDYDFDGPGGQIYHGGASLVVSNSILVYGFATYGAGIFNAGGRLAVRDSELRTGYAITSGGGIFNESGALQIDTSRVLTNIAGYTGGGVYNNNGGVMTITGAVINANATQGYSCGGVCNELSSAAWISGTEIGFNSVANNHGGGIDHGSGSMTILRSRIHDNKATYYGAGILSWYSSTLLIEDSEIDHNIGNPSTSSGGGLNTFGDRLSISRTRFYSNSAGYGGGLFLGAVLQEIDGSVVASNTSVLGGGGGAWLAGGVVYLTRTTFISNASGGYGGGLYAVANFALNALNMRSVTVTDNFAASYGGGLFVNAGVNPIRIDGSDVAIEKNRTAYAGAGIYASGLYTLSLSGFRVNRNVNLLPSGGSGGAGLQVYGTSAAAAQVTLTDGEIRDNSSTSTGGGIDARGVDARLTRVRIEGNRAYNAGGILTTGLGPQAATMLIDSSVISANVAITAGAGGLWNTGNAWLAITGTQVVSNVALSSGGGIYNNGTVTNTRLLITNSAVISNVSGTSFAGGIYNSAYARLSGSRLGGNVAPTSYAGGLYNESGLAEFSDSMVDGNRAGTAGGGLMNFLNATLSVQNTTIASNTASSGEGGGIWNAVAALVMTDTRVVDNRAVNGGGIYSPGTLTATGLIVDRNVAVTGSSGGIYAGSTAEIRNSFVRNNSTGVGDTPAGGGIYLATTSALIANTVISGNAAGFGGALVSTGNTRIYDSAIYANTARNQSGGAITQLGGQLAVSRTAIYSNTATGPTFPQGGGIYVQSSLAITLSNVTLSGNVAGFGGGLMLNSVTSAWITATTIARNIAITLTPSIGSTGVQARIANSIIGFGLGNGNECNGPQSDQGYNIETSNSCGFSAPSSLNNQFGMALDPLRNNGGANAWNWTHSLPPGSVAIDRIPAANCIVATDQRGMARPQPIGTGRCDVGAYESDAPDLSLIKSVSTLTALPGQRITYTLSFSNASAIVTATGAFITDVIAAQLSGVSFAASLPITPTGAVSYVFALPPLIPGAGGVITISGIVSATAPGDFLIVNIAEIGGAGDVTALNNTSTATTTVTVPRARFSSSAASAYEGSGFAALTITLTATNPYLGTPVFYQTFDGSAAAGSDYTATSGIAVVPAGQLAIPITIPLVDDGVVEGPETFIVQLTALPGSALGVPAITSVTIYDGSLPTPRAFVPLTLK